MKALEEQSPLHAGAEQRCHDRRRRRHAETDNSHRRILTAALRVGFAQAWRALVAAEMIGASQGIGWMVAVGGQIGNSSQVLLGIALIGLTAWLMESLVFRGIERRYESWRGQ
jgi:ABC-type nitrate/sulfonate/bicarbonate transport system permease component